MRPLFTVVSFTALSACSPPPAPLDASTADAPAADAPALDAPATDTPAADAPSSLAPCSFNRDCPVEERCGCTEAAGCRCERGARGAGRAGIDPCASGNDCASALCVEGAGGAMVCSDPCTGPGDCPAALPRCISVPTVGSFCARDPAATGDGGTSGDAGVPGCAGACARTTLVAAFGARSEPFDRAQHGRSGADGLYVEAHFGGSPACPSASSPTPDRTLVLSGIRAAPGADGGGAAQTEADGVRATLFDFRGTLTSMPLLRATAVRVTPRFVEPGRAVSFEVSATFPGGTVTGGFFALHCTSLDER